MALFMQFKTAFFLTLQGMILVFDAPRDRVETRTCDVSSMKALMAVIMRNLSERMTTTKQELFLDLLAGTQGQYPRKFTCN